MWRILNWVGFALMAVAGIMSLVVHLRAMPIRALKGIGLALLVISVLLMELSNRLMEIPLVLKGTTVVVSSRGVGFGLFAFLFFLDGFCLLMWDERFIDFFSPRSLKK